MANLRAFQAQLNSFVKEIKRSHVKLVLKVAKAAHQTAYRMTPIDTSRAMSGWVVQIGTPFLGEPKYIPGSRGSTLAEAINLNESNIREVHGAYRFGETLIIRNNVPYIEILEAGPSGGGSPQAPNGMMSFALQAAKAAMKS